MERKRLFVYASILTALCFAVAPSFAQDTTGHDITEEILKGPSDLDPEKILGPGGIGIDTHKDILMSFGATVRLIPTAESNWDFGMKDEVPGYINTGPLKNYFAGNLAMGEFVQGIYRSSIALNDTIVNNDQNADVIAAFDDYSTSLSGANNANVAHPTLNAGIAQAATGMGTINQLANQSVQGIAVPVSNPIANAAAEAAANAAVAGLATAASDPSA